MKIKCECDAVLELPETFFDDAFGFWKEHGHFPDDVTLICECGKTHSTGADNEPDPAAAWLISHAWYENHKQHQTVRA